MKFFRFSDSATCSTKGCASCTRLGRTALVAAIVLASCTTYVRPVSCGIRPNCGEPRDLKYCENVVMAVHGTDCPKLGLVVGRPFVFVTSGHCLTSNYTVDERDCAVSQYKTVGEWHECPPGEPTFER